MKLTGRMDVPFSAFVRNFTLDAGDHRVWISFEKDVERDTATRIARALFDALEREVQP